MSLRGANLRGANLVQAQVAADLSDADLSGVHAAYARLNQSVLRGAEALAYLRELRAVLQRGVGGSTLA